MCSIDQCLNGIYLNNFIPYSRIGGSYTSRRELLARVNGPSKAHPVVVSVKDGIVDLHEGVSHNKKVFLAHLSDVQSRDSGAAETLSLNI